MTGLTRLTSGTARLNGFDVGNPGIESRRQCGLVPQSINLDRELSVFENLNIHGKLFRMSKEKTVRRIDELLDYVEMGDRKDALVKNLSGGMKRRLMIARALLHSPAILFLDEPTVGLDAGMRRKIWALIKKIQQHGTTVFLTTHYIEEAEFLANRVAFLDNGSIVVVDTPANLMKQQGNWAQNVIYVLPLTHASTAIRTASFGDTPPLFSLFILAAIGALFFYLSVLCVKRAKD